MEKPKKTITWEKHIPETVNDCKKMYTTGKNSILNNIPFPNVKLLQDNKHSYISLKICCISQKLE